MPTEVNMVLLMRGEQNGSATVKFQPAKFNLDTREGKLLKTEEAGEFHDFIAEAITDMDTICSAHVLEHAKALRDNDATVLTDEVRNDLYMRLLASFSEKPMELVGNMLAGMLVGCIEGMVEEPNFDEVYADFHSGEAASE
jgi:hypothetical protein